MIERIPIIDREQWLALRKQDVTASVVGALFGVHAYETAYGLFVEKTRELPDEGESKAMRRGRLLEPIVAQAVADDHPEWTIRKAEHYYRDPALRLGCTPDFLVEGDPRGPGIIQAKTAGPWAFKRSWLENDAPPFWITLQAAVEIFLTGATWGAVAVLVNDDDLALHWYDVPKNVGVEQRIVEAVQKFWADVEFEDIPEPDYSRDAELIKALTPKSVELKTIDLTGDNHLPILLAERAELKERVRAETARVKEIDAEVIHKMGDAEIASLPGFAISFKSADFKGYSVAPSVRRTLRITDHREKEVEHDGSAF